MTESRSRFERARVGHSAMALNNRIGIESHGASQSVIRLGTGDEELMTGGTSWQTRALLRFRHPTLKERKHPCARTEHVPRLHAFGRDDLVERHVCL